MKTILYFFILTVPASVLGQGVLNESWFITKEGLQQQRDIAWGVDVDDQNNIYWATTQSVNALDVKDVYVYKLSPSGTEIWSVPYIYGGQYEQQAYISVLKDSIFYVAGRDFHDYGFPPFKNGSDAFVFALDTASHDTLWTFVWDGGYSYEEVDGLVVEDDGIYITGWTEDSVTKMDIFVMKLSLQGDSLWLTKFGTSNYDQADGHCVVDDSTIYISGMLNSVNALFQGDAVLAAFNRSDGSYKWHVLWEGPNQEDGLGLNSDGDFLYQCGITSSHGDSAVFINKYDKNGGLIWNVLTNKATKTRSLDFAPDGSFYLAATTNSEGAGGEDLMIMQFDTAAGNLLNYRTWGGTANESVQDIRIKGNYMYLTGRTISYSGNADDDALLIKAPLFTTTGNRLPEMKPHAEVFPVPASEKIFFNFEKETGSLKLKVYNLSGQLLCDRIIKNKASLQLDVSTFSCGTYWWQLSDDRESLDAGSFIIER